MTIAPSGRRAPLNWVRLIAFALAAMMGGAITFGIAGAVGSVWEIRPMPSLGLVVVAGLWIGTWHGTRFAFPPLPYRRGQVPRSWSESLTGVVRFGAALGLGMATNVSSGLLHFAFILAFLEGSLRTGVVAGVVFGIARSAPVLLAFMVPTYPRDPDDYKRFFTRYLPPSRRLALNLAVLLASASTASMLLMRVLDGS